MNCVYVQKGVCMNEVSIGGADRIVRLGRFPLAIFLFFIDSGHANAG